MIECKNLQKSYGHKRVLTNVHLTIEEPKIVALVGRNGAGKTTLLKLLAGQLKPSGGELAIANERPFNNLKVAKNTILIHERMQFPSSFTLLEILNGAAHFYPNWQQKLAEKLIHYAELNIYGYYDQLSKGQAATFRLIYGLCARCAYTYLDEPMNGMDDGIRADFYRAILKEYIAAPRLIIISTHYVNEIRHLAEDVVILHDGQIDMHTTLEELALFALKLVGPKAAVLEAVGSATVLFKVEEQSFYEVYVVAAELDERNLQSMQVSMQPVEAHVAIRLLTTNRQGGIDDVFRA